jgi:DnaJ domain
MKFDSPLFDRIRVRPEADRHPQTGCRSCEWPGCAHDGTHRAPKGRLRQGEYWRFCLDHVREYNRAYDFFAGMSEDAIIRYQKDALTGHRPTWKMGVNGKRASEDRFQFAAEDPLGLFRDLDAGWRPGAQSPAAPERRPVRNAERKALNVLGLEAGVTAPEIKARFKLLVKRHHPDANGGDRSCEDRLREIIQAYNYLRSVGWL